MCFCFGFFALINIRSSVGCSLSLFLFRRPGNGTFCKIITFWGSINTVDSKGDELYSKYSNKAEYFVSTAKTMEKSTNQPKNDGNFILPSLQPNAFREASFDENQRARDQPLMKRAINFGSVLFQFNDSLAEICIFLHATHRVWEKSSANVNKSCRPQNESIFSQTQSSFAKARLFRAEITSNHFLLIKFWNHLHSVSVLHIHFFACIYIPLVNGKMESFKFPVSLRSTSQIAIWLSKTIYYTIEWFQTQHDVICNFILVFVFAHCIEISKNHRKSLRQATASPGWRNKKGEYKTDAHRLVCYFLRVIAITTAVPILLCLASFLHTASDS